MEEEAQKVESAAPKSKGKLWLIIVIVLVILGAAAAAYFLLGNKSGNGGGGVLSSITPAKLNPSCKYNDPDLCKFINGWKDVKYMTMNSVDTDKDGKVTNSVFKMEGEDNSQITVTQDGKEAYNTISIANTTYTKDYSDNKWFKYTSTDETLKSEESQVNFDEKADSVEDKTTYEKIGTEACGKLSCFKYKVIDPANTDYTEYIFFDNKDYQLRKTRTEMADGSVSEGTYDYGKVSISAPSPTKEGSPWDALTGGSSTTTNPVITPSVENSNIASDGATDLVPEAAPTDNTEYDGTE